VVKISIVVLWIVTPCSIVLCYQQFGGTYRLIFRPWRWMREVPPKRWWQYSRLHGVKIHKTTIDDKILVPNRILLESIDLLCASLFHASSPIVSLIQQLTYSVIWAYRSMWNLIYLWVEHFTSNLFPFFNANDFGNPVLLLLCMRKSQQKGTEL
jgi:hypothetical protein